MATSLATRSANNLRHRDVRPVRPRGIGSRLAQHAVPILAALTVGIALAGGFVAYQAVSDGGGGTYTDGRTPTSFGALWIESFEEVASPKIDHKGMYGFPQTGPPEKVSLDVIVRLANTTAAPVELTPARFALRLGASGKPISVEGASFDEVSLLPGAVFDARMQFPVKGGEHRLSLLFDDPDGSGPIAIDLGQAQFQDTADPDHEEH